MTIDQACASLSSHCLGLQLAADATTAVITTTLQTAWWGRIKNIHRLNMQHTLMANLTEWLSE